MKLAAVIGDPISHSRSPRLHGHWLNRYGINGAYVPLHVTPDTLAETLNLLPQLGFSGINVTLPHKEAVFALATQVTDRAARIGAANTLTFTRNGFEADNTDGYGFLANLDQTAPDWDKDRPAVVLGAGGAARGIVATLLDAGLPEIRVANRTQARADALRAEFGNQITVTSLTAPDLSDAGLLVNTTSLGMAGQPPLNLDLGPLPRDALVTDIVYTPLQTPLLQAAADRDLRTVDGLGMLLHQAVPGFARWFGTPPEVDEDLRQVMLS